MNKFMSRDVVVLRGFSGSGKSTVAAEMARTRKRVQNGAMVAIVSADDFFDAKAKELGTTYAEAFNPAQLGDAHGACFKRFIGCCVERFDLIIVDNTCTRAVEIAPYMLAASAYGFTAKVLHVPCDVETALARGVHGVPRKAIEGQAATMERESLPPWWEQEELEEPDGPDPEALQAQADAIRELSENR